MSYKLTTSQMDYVLEAIVKTELPVQPQVQGTQSYVCPQIPIELIGHTEIAFRGPGVAPLLYLRGYAPKQDYVVRQTIRYNSRHPQEVLDDKTFILVSPLPENSPELPKFQKLIVIVRKILAENPHYAAPQCDQVVRA